MKKLLTIIALGLIGTTAAKAQQLVLRTMGGFKPVPASVTCDGKGRIAVISEDNDDDEVSITILNRDLQTEAEIKAASYGISYAVHQYTTTLKISDFVTVESRMVDQETEQYSFENLQTLTGIAIQDKETFRNAISSYSQLSGLDFFDCQGYDYCVVDTTDNNSYYEYQMYGKAFPRYFYAAKNNTVYSVSLYYNINTDQLNAFSNDMRGYVEKNSDKLTWTKENEEPEMFKEYFDVVGTRIFSIDNGDNNVDVKDIYTTQNLFNNDDKWEYIVQAYEPSLSTTAPRMNVGWNMMFNAGMVRFWGWMPDGEAPEVNCLKIMSQDGTCLGVLNFPDVDLKSGSKEDLKIFIINGKPHFLIETEEYEDNKHTSFAYLYSYDSESNSIHLIERTPIAEGRTYNLSGIEVDGSAKGIVIKNGKKMLIGK